MMCSDLSATNTHTHMTTDNYLPNLLPSPLSSLSICHFICKQVISKQFNKPQHVLFFVSGWESHSLRAMRSLIETRAHTPMHALARFNLEYTCRRWVSAHVSVSDRQIMGCQKKQQVFVLVLSPLRKNDPGKKKQRPRWGGDGGDLHLDLKWAFY